jgi:hypothetical protein
MMPRECPSIARLPLHPAHLQRTHGLDRRATAVLGGPCELRVGDGWLVHGQSQHLPYTQSGITSAGIAI